MNEEGWKKEKKEKRVLENRREQPLPFERVRLRIDLLVMNSLRGFLGSRKITFKKIRKKREGKKRKRERDVKAQEGKPCQRCLSSSLFLSFFLSLSVEKRSS